MQVEPLLQITTSNIQIFQKKWEFITSMFEQQLHCMDDDIHFMEPS